jgi:hypothetical protein
LQRVKGVIAGFVVGAPFAGFLWFWLHAEREWAALVGFCIGLAIFAVVATRSDSRDAAADLAWREVASDLPPYSERAALERVQVDMPGPDRKPVTTGVSEGRPTHAKRRAAANQGSESK